MIRGRGFGWTAILPVLVLAAAVLVFFNKLALTNLILARGDTLLYFYPYWQAAAEALKVGRVPLWNPDLFMGSPFLANSQVGFFYPLNWPFWLLLRTPYAVSGSILLHLMIAGIGTYGAGRRQLGLGRPAALLAAMLFALGGYLTAQVEHVNQLQGLAWLPWFFVVWRPVAGQGRRQFFKQCAAIGVLFALQLLAGHTQTVFITAVGVGVWGFGFGGQGVGMGGVVKGVLGRVWPVGVGAVAGVLLAAVQLLPTLELSQQSSRQGGLPLNEVLSFSFHPLLAGRGLLPGYGQSLFSEYVAFLPLMALVMALIAVWQWRRVRVVRPFVLLAVVGLLLALGRFNPLYYVLGQLPGFNLFRVPARWLVLYGFSMALLAGYGWQMIRKEGRGRAKKSIRIVILVVVGIVIWAWVSVPLSRWVPIGAEAVAEFPTGLTMVGWALEVGLVLFIFYFRKLPVKPALSLGGICLLVLFMGSRELPYNNLTTPEAYFDLRPSITRIQAAAPQNGPKPRLLSLSDIFFDPGDLAEIGTIYEGRLSEAAFYDYTVAIKQKEIAAPNLPLAYGLSSLDGFDGGVLPLRNYTTLTALLLPEGVETVDGRLREYLEQIPEARWLDLFGARFIITDKVGDVWLAVAPDMTAYFDLQHVVNLEAGEKTAAAYLPEFEASSLMMVGNGPVIIDIMTESGEGYSIEPEAVGEDLWRVSLGEVRVVKGVEITAELDGTQIQAVTLVNEVDRTFQSLALGNYRLIHSGDVKIYENLDVLPRAFMVYEWLYRPSVAGGVSAMDSADFDPSRQAVIVADGPERLFGEGQGAVEIIGYGPERIELAVETNERGLLVLTEANYPGWEAEIDGEGVKIEQTDGLFRGVVVPAGTHEVVFYFRPLTYRIGLIISLVSLCLVGGGLFVAMKKAK